VQTADRIRSCTITGAARIAAGKVVIGNIRERDHGNGCENLEQ
jgi:hypothetical protein